MQNYPSRVEWESAREPLRAHWLVVSNCASGISISAVSEKKGKIALSFKKKEYNRPYTIDNLQVRWSESEGFIVILSAMLFYFLSFFLSLSHSLTVDSQYQYSIGSRDACCCLLVQISIVHILSSLLHYVR